MVVKAGSTKDPKALSDNVVARSRDTTHTRASRPRWSHQPCQRLVGELSVVAQDEGAIRFVRPGLGLSSRLPCVPVRDEGTHHRARRVGAPNHPQRSVDNWLGSRSCRAEYGLVWSFRESGGGGPKGPEPRRREVEAQPHLGFRARVSQAKGERRVR